jgi:hypothetical protein
MIGLVTFRLAQMRDQHPLTPEPVRCRSYSTDL